MKIKLLTTLIAGALLAGCGSDNDNSVTPEIKAKQVQAYDGAVNGMVASFSCTDGATGKTDKKTDGFGFVLVKNNTFALQPQTCKVTLSVPKGGIAIDMSNGKDMSNVTYTIPQGLLSANQPIAATPFTTLIDKAIKDSGETNPENIDLKAITEDVFTSLGIDTSVVNPTALMAEPEKTLKSLDPKVAQDVTAKTMVLSDVLVAQKDNTAVKVDDIAAVTATVASDLIDKNPAFPQASEGSNDKVYVDLTEVLAKEENFNQAANGKVPQDVENENKNPTITPENELPNPEKPPVDPNITGSTGGSEGDNSGGTGA